MLSFDARCTFEDPNDMTPYCQFRSKYFLLRGRKLRRRCDESCSVKKRVEVGMLVRDYCLAKWKVLIGTGIIDVLQIF